MPASLSLSLSSCLYLSPAKFHTTARRQSSFTDYQPHTVKLLTHMQMHTLTHHWTRTCSKAQRIHKLRASRSPQWVQWNTTVSAHTQIPPEHSELLDRSLHRHTRTFNPGVSPMPHASRPVLTAITVKYSKMWRPCCYIQHLKSIRNVFTTHLTSVLGHTVGDIQVWDHIESLGFKFGNRQSFRILKNAHLKKLW